MSQEKQTAEEVVQKFIDSHESGTFVKNKEAVNIIKFHPKPIN